MNEIVLTPDIVESVTDPELIQLLQEFMSFKEFALEFMLIIVVLGFLFFFTYLVSLALRV